MSEEVDTNVLLKELVRHEVEEFARGMATAFDRELFAIYPTGGIPSSREDIVAIFLDACRHSERGCSCEADFDWGRENLNYWECVAQDDEEDY